MLDKSSNTYKKRNDEILAKYLESKGMSFDEDTRDAIKLGFISSFCSSCYRLGRLDGDFIDMAKSGLIKLFCHPNGLTTLMECL